MKLWAWGLGLGVVLVLPRVVSAQGGAPSAATSVTLFNSGTVLIRRTLPITVPAGSSTQSLTLGAFAPATLSSLDPGVTVTGVRFDPDWSEASLLRRNIGRHFFFERTGGTARSATLVAVDPERWQWDSGGKVIFGRPGQIQWPSELVPIAPVADVAFRADRARQNVRVMYHASGGSWNASYRLFLGPQGHIEGIASLDGGTLIIADAEVQLLAGDIGAARGGAFEAKANMAAAPQLQRFAADAASVESVGESHLYTLPGRITFVPGVQLAQPLFDPAPARGERRYTAPGALTFYGGLNQLPDEQPVPVEVSYRFDRKAGTSFGDLVLPAGDVAIYDADAAGRMQLIGQGNIPHTPAGKELSIATGTAFDVTVTRVQTDYATTRSQPAPNLPSRTIATASYRVTVQNAKDSAVVVEVREDHSGEWSVIESSVPGQKRSSTRTVFPVTVPAKGSAVLTYKVRVVW